MPYQKSFEFDGPSNTLELTKARRFRSKTLVYNILCFSLVAVNIDNLIYHFKLSNITKRVLVSRISREILIQNTSL